MKSLVICMCVAACGGAPADSPSAFQTDVLATSKGDVKITAIGHGTLMFQFGDMVVHIDPVGRYADYSKLPKADLILVTHEHGDHLDARAIKQLTKSDTALIVTPACAEKLGQGIVMKNGDAGTYKGVPIEAVPAYNIAHKRSDGSPYHPKGRGNGYVITFGDQRVYVAGDTENIPEMSQLEKIAVAFLPMNLPYTMTPEMVADAVHAIHPKIVYPYHFGKTDPQRLVTLLKDDPQVTVRVRRLQ